MENENLTGIERELVLQYLIDGNIPVTLTPIDENAETDKAEMKKVRKSVQNILFGAIEKVKQDD